MVREAEVHFLYQYVFMYQYILLSALMEKNKEKKITLHVNSTCKF